MEESVWLTWQNLDTTCLGCHGRTGHCHVCTRVPCTGHSGWRTVLYWGQDFQDRTGDSLYWGGPTLTYHHQHTSLLKDKVTLMLICFLFIVFTHSMVRNPFVRKYRQRFQA